MNLKLSLAQAIAALSELPIEQVAGMLAAPKQREHGDLAFPCFPLAKAWKLSPPECAERLRSELTLPDGFRACEVAGPYLNFRYDRGAYSSHVLNEILSQASDYGKQPERDDQVVIEYSAPNIAKTFHVGHLRTTLIGHSLVQIYKHLGYQVVGVNHLGDWGTQFGFVYAGCEIWGKPDQPTVESLVEIYRRATNLRKLQEQDQVPEEDKDKPDLNNMAREYFIRLEAGEREAFDFWKWCLDISMDYFKEMYARLGIEFDHYTGESFYRDMLPEIETWLKQTGILEDSRGALGVDLGKKLGFVRVFAEDGRSLYITRDIACAIYRYDHFSPVANIYVVAAQQSLHFKQLIALLKAAKHPAADVMQHVSFGFVPGMSTREGGAISLKDYLDEAHQRALDTYRSEVQRRPEGVDEDQVAEAVAIGATYFYFLSHSNIKDFQFSWEMALNFQGDTGPYLQYAVARINSIEAKAKEAGIVEVEINQDCLTTDAAFHLLRLLSQLPERVSKAQQDNEPYYIAHYLLDVAKQFSKAYQELKVVGEEASVASTHLALFRATRSVLEIGLRLIGVPVIERM